MNFEEKHVRNLKQINGKAVHFRVDEVRLPDGNTASREFVNHPGAVAVIPFVDAKHIVLVEQFRYPVKEVTYEIPAGKLDKHERPLLCVKRELEEETGFRAGKIKKLVSFWPTPAFSDEIIHIYSATRLKKHEASPDADEFIRAKIVSLEQALKWIKNGRIKDSKTVIGLLMWGQRKNV